MLNTVMHVTVSVIGSVNGQGKMPLNLTRIWIVKIWKRKTSPFATLLIVYHCTGHTLATVVYSGLELFIADDVMSIAH